MRISNIHTMSMRQPIRNGVGWWGGGTQVTLFFRVTKCQGSFYFNLKTIKKSRDKFRSWFIWNAFPSCSLSVTLIVCSFSVTIISNRLVLCAFGQHLRDHILFDLMSVSGDYCNTLPSLFWNMAITIRQIFDWKIKFSESPIIAVENFQSCSLFFFVIITIIK